MNQLAIALDEPINKIGEMSLDVSEILGKNLARILRERGIRNKTFAAQLGVDENQVSRWKGGRGMSAGTIQRICAVLDIQPDDLYRSPSDQITDEYIPVVSQVQAGPEGLWVDAYPVGHGIEKIRRPPDLSSPQAYGLKICGESMAPKYLPAQIVVVDPSRVPVSGDFVVVRLSSGEVMAKRYRPKDGFVILESVNPAFEPIMVPVEDLVFVHKIVWSREK